jgi:hypothetical protein
MQRTVIIDDIDGTIAKGTIRFAIDGDHYEIDLSSKHDAALREILAQYISAGRKAGAKTAARPGRKPGRATVLTGVTMKPSNATNGLIAGNDEIRAWLKANGFQVKDRGRISATLVDTFKSRQPIARAS